VILDTGFWILDEEIKIFVQRWRYDNGFAFGDIVVFTKFAHFKIQSIDCNKNLLG